MLQLANFPDEMIKRMKENEQQRLDNYIHTVSLKDLNFDVILALHTKRKNIEVLGEELHLRNSQTKSKC